MAKRCKGEVSWEKQRKIKVLIYPQVPVQKYAEYCLRQLQRLRGTDIKPSIEGIERAKVM